MDLRLLDLLACPACLPAERPLTATVGHEADGDLLEGRLACSGCGRRYPVAEGVATLLPERRGADELALDRYEGETLGAAYLWSHYADLWGDPDADGSGQRWADLAGATDGIALDAGCAVGRLTFELAGRSELAVGVDRSTAFVRLARRLKQEGRLDLRLPLEGELSEPRTIIAPAPWHRDRVEFLVADAQALPFRRDAFALVTSLNLVDKLPRPLSHLEQLDRVARPAGARLLFADPFSWSTAVALPREWLGGTAAGPFAGHGRENVRRHLATRGAPPWRLRQEGELWWKLRSHRNHFELIRSEYLLCER